MTLQLKDYIGLESNYPNGSLKSDEQISLIYLFLYLSEQKPDNSFDSIQPKGYIGLETSVRNSSSPYMKFLPADPNKGCLLISGSLKSY